MLGHEVQSPLCEFGGKLTFRPLTATLYRLAMDTGDEQTRLYTPLLQLTPELL